MKNKKIIGGLFALLLTLTTIYAFAATPFPPWIRQITGDVTINKNGVSSYTAGSVAESDLAALSGSAGQLNAMRQASFIYDVAVDGGTLSAKSLGVALPAKAVIVRSFFKIITAFEDSGSTTVALSCEDANNIKTATDFTGLGSANTFVDGESTGAIAGFKRGIAAACNITATPASGTSSDRVTAGKLIGWVQYVVED